MTDEQRQAIRAEIPLMLLCLAAPLRAEPTREELKREAEELRKMGERAEKKTPPAKKGNGR